MVYNRSVDFELSEARHAALRAAYEAGAVVMTPNPHHHTLFANKRNLVALSDQNLLEAMAIDERHCAALCQIPKTVSVTKETADRLWENRRNLFFKPIAGHGGKAVYRGDKLTRKAWAAVLAGTYVAQERIPPTERIVALDGEATRHKLDVRLYTYLGGVLLMGARLYQGQTTNFRTPGGGFSPVFIV
jgi:hypothetical protein